MNHAEKKQTAAKGEAVAQTKEGSCTGAQEVGASANAETAAGKAPDASFEDFNLDDIEVIESKVFA